MCWCLIIVLSVAMLGLCDECPDAVRMALLLIWKATLYARNVKL